MGTDQSVNEIDELLEKELADHPEWDKNTQEIIKNLYQELREIKAENVRLRKALLRASGNQPKMSSKLRDALYE